jgi:HD-GYP domain-containing protein (c-di-GMP phosphodiesterase class II)
LADEGNLRIAVSGEELIYRDRRTDASTGPTYGLLRRLTDKGVGFLEIRQGVTRDEIESFCTALADAQGKVLRASDHIKIGTASIADLSTRTDHPELLRVRNLGGKRDDPVTEEALLVQGLALRVREDYAVQARDLKDIVLSLLSHMSYQGNIFLNLAEVRDHNLFTYLHTCNVATLSMGFGLALGLEGDVAHDLGTAALLHDMGKNFIPQEILDRAGPLTSGEWALIQEHPIRGAEMLMRQEGVNHLAVTVALEHHMHHDGVGGYPKTHYTPCLQSQLIAIADTFDALFGKRSYHAKFDVLDALEILQVHSGSIYNPQLVDEFSRFMNTNIDRFEFSPE